jgi:hypothetical protein
MPGLLGWNRQNMKHPTALLIGVLLLWIVTILSVAVQPIVWWHTVLLGAVTLFMTGLYLKERRAGSSY